MVAVATGGLMKIALADVPPVPAGLAPALAPDGDKVYAAGLQRWRFDAEGTLEYFIRYAADGKTREDVYAAPRKR